MGAIGPEMTVGSRVKHPKLGTGCILEFRKYNGVLVNFSNKQGVLVRVVHKKDLEVIDGTEKEN